MYVEFRLAIKGDPNAASAAHVGLAIHLIDRDLQAWSNKYNIAYKTKVHKLSKRVMFEDSTTYSFFALTFEPTSYTANRWSLTEPMSSPKKL